MSTIVGTNIEVTNIKYDSDTTAMIVSSTGGGAGTVPQGLCKSWIDYKTHTSNETLDSFNTSSYTDQGTGVGEIAITNVFSSINWVCTAGGWGTDASNGNIIPDAGNAGHTNKYWLYTFWTNSSGYDTLNVHGMAFGDLA